MVTMMPRSVTVLAAALLCLPVLAQDPDSPDPKQRVRAARQLADQGSTAIPTLARLLKDPEPRVRLQAVKSIVKIGTQRSIAPLVEATKDPDPEIQIRAIDGLVNFYLPGYVTSGWFGSLKKTGTAIKGMFTDTNDAVIRPDIRVQPEVIEALGRLARGGASMKVRANAARALGILRGRAAVPDLIEAIKKTKDSEVIYEALIALQKIRDQSAAPHIAFLLRDLDDRVQVAAIETVGLLQYHKALPQLYDVLANARNKKVRRAALTAIAMLPDEKNRPYYDQYITDKDPLMRAAAAEGYARLKNPADLRMLQTYFDSEKKMNPRLSLAFALVMLGQTDLGQFTPLQYLIHTLNSASFKGVAEPFLIELAREPRVRESLYKALDGATRDEKIGIARVLARSGGKDSIPHLERLVRDPDNEVSTEAATALRILRARLGG